MLKKFHFETQNIFFFQAKRNDSNAVFEPLCMAGAVGFEPTTYSFGEFKSSVALLSKLNTTQYSSRILADRLTTRD